MLLHDRYKIKYLRKIISHIILKMKQKREFQLKVNSWYVQLECVVGKLPATKKIMQNDKETFKTN